MCEFLAVRDNYFYFGSIIIINYSMERCTVHLHMMEKAECSPLHNSTFVDHESTYPLYVLGQRMDVMGSAM